MTNNNVEQNLTETIALNIKNLHKKKGCKTAGGQRRVRKKTSLNRKKDKNSPDDLSMNNDNLPKVTGLAQLKNLEKQINDLQKDISSVGYNNE